MVEESFIIVYLQATLQPLEAGLPVAVFSITA